MVSARHQDGRHRPHLSLDGSDYSTLQAYPGSPRTATPIFLTWSQDRRLSVNRQMKDPPAEHAGLSSEALTGLVVSPGEARLVGPGTHAGARIGAACRCVILVGRLVMLILPGRVRAWLGADRGRVGMVVLVRIPIRRHLIMALLEGSLAAGFRKDGLRRRSDYRGNSRCRCAACRRQRRDRLRVRSRSDTGQQPQTEDGRFEQARHSGSPVNIAFVVKLTRGHACHK